MDQKLNGSRTDFDQLHSVAVPIKHDQSRDCGLSSTYSSPALANDDGRLNVFPYLPESE